MATNPIVRLRFEVEDDVYTSVGLGASDVIKLGVDAVISLFVEESDVMQSDLYEEYSDLVEDYPDEIFYEYLWDGAPYESANFFLPFDKVMTVVAVAYDDMRNPCRLYREVVYFTEDGCSSVEEYEAMASAKSCSVLPKSVVVGEPVVKGRQSEVTLPIYSESKSAELKFKAQQIRAEALVSAAAERKAGVQQRSERFVAR
jgi:hypothetical protein